MIVQNKSTGGWAIVTDEVGADLIAGGRFKEYEAPAPKPARRPRKQTPAPEAEALAQEPAGDPFSGE